jgi:hypothetical protein
MRTRITIRSGRCWVPPEWRGPLNIGMFRHSAIIAVAGTRDKEAARDLLASHLPLVAVIDDEADVDADDIAMQDDVGATRMARRLSRLRPAAGTRELRRAGLVAPQIPAVYAWRVARHGEHVFRVSPDGTFTAVALFRVVRSQDGRGQWESELVASRPW